MKIKLQKKQTSEEMMSVNKTSIENEYRELFTTSNCFEGVDRETNRYLLSLLWDYGYILGFLAPDNETVIFGTMAIYSYDYKGTPKVVHPILPLLKSQQSFKEVTSSTLTIGKNAVVGYYANNHQPVKSLVNYYIQKIVEIDNAIDFNREQSKIPWIISYTMKNKNVATMIENSIAKNEIVTALPLSTGELEKLVPSNLTVPYLIDKYQAQRKEYEGKIKSILGINNVDFEKKERLLTDEVKANDEEIGNMNLSHERNIKEFCKELNQMFNTSLDFNKVNKKEIPEDERKDDEDEENL